ncbi:MAG: PQQ-dependent sugar dehydrogenase, partial [Flavobacteriaceae bacterium]
MKKIYYLCLFFSVFSLSIFAQEAVTYESAFPNLSFEFPVEIQNANDASNRLFVVEQSGRIKVFQNNKSTSDQQIFLDIRNEVSFSSGQEIGLLGLAFHPNFKQNGYFFVYYTRNSSVANIGVEIVIARYKVNANNPNQADVSSRLEILSFDKNQNHSNHNGGKIAFGPDGYLYASFGDGGGGGDPNKNAQNLNNPFGSILRIDIDIDGNNPLESNPDAPNGNYEIPSDNPLLGKSGMDELYAWGIRNTWKFSFEPSTNRMWGADVGQNEYEEINLIQKGGNYGWNRFEANATYNSATSLAANPDIKPIFQYDHNNGDVSITGGYVYNGASNNTNLLGKYIYADYVTGRVWALDYNATNNSATSKLLFRTNGEYVSSFGLDEAGELYFSGYGNAAKIFKIIGGSENTGPETTSVNGVGEWKGLENGSNGTIEAIVSIGEDTYVAGAFTMVGSISANNIAVYNKANGWKALSTGANGKVNALAVAADGSIFAGGEFTIIGGTPANHVAVWKGSNWSALGSGTDGAVAKIGVDSKNNVYVGGAFEKAGELTVHNIAKWNNGWSALTDSGTTTSGTNNEIRAIALDQNDMLIVGGNFDSAGGKSANRIATWNGSNWATLGEGTSGFVQSILVQSGYIYAGGNFILAGNKTVNRIARWNMGSKSWETIGNGVSGNVNSLASDGSYIYLGGNFETAANLANSNVIVNNMARWSISGGYQALGPNKNVGTDNLVNNISFAEDNEVLFVGGSFTTSGNVTASKIAVWSQSFDCTDTRITME